MELLLLWGVQLCNYLQKLDLITKQYIIYSMSVLILNQRLIKRGVQLFYSSKDLSSCLSHIYSSQESITLTSKPDKLKKSRMLGTTEKTISYNKLAWAKQLHYQVSQWLLHCNKVGGGGCKNYFPLRCL